MPCSRSARRDAVRAASSLAAPHRSWRAPNLIRRQVQLAEHRLKRLARIERVQEQLPHPRVVTAAALGLGPRRVGHRSNAIRELVIRICTAASPQPPLI